jgi:GNAT superfamily N-acetyltransferase
MPAFSASIAASVNSTPAGERRAIDIVRVESRADRHRFVDLPFGLHAADPHWRPPIRSEIHDLISGEIRRNPWFEHAQLGLWLALDRGKVVGRISAQVDDLVQARMGQGIGQWGMFECINDPVVADALLQTAEDWLRSKGMTRSAGPFSLSVWDECGLLVECFDTPPTVMMGHNPAYYPGLVERRGYVGIKDLYAYTVPLHGLSERLARMVALGKDSARIRIRRIDRSRFAAEVALILNILNDAWSENWGFIPMTALEIAHAAKKLKPILYEDLVYVAEVDGEPMAFMLTLPDLNELTADLDGKLLPLGWAKLLHRLRHPKVDRVRVPLMGVRKAFHGTRLASLAALMMIDRTRDAAASCYQAKEAELGWVLEDNQAMRRMAVSGGGRITKTYRIYERLLR